MSLLSNMILANEKALKPCHKILTNLYPILLAEIMIDMWVLEAILLIRYVFLKQ